MNGAPHLGDMDGRGKRVPADIATLPGYSAKRSKVERALQDAKPAN